jgi:hypothetical protein
MDEEHVVVPFGAHMYAVRRAGDANALGALPAPTGAPRVLAVQLPSLASTSYVVYNIACSVEYDEPARTGIFPALRERVARAVPHPRNSMRLNTVFGNAWFQVCPFSICCAVCCAVCWAVLWQVD